jgi:hypothetical protein
MSNTGVDDSFKDQAVRADAFQLFGVKSLTASTTLIRQIHDGVPLILNAAAGLTVTLPAATGSGAIYTFIVGTTVTSNAYVIQVTGDDTMKGVAWIAADGGNTVVAFEAAADSDTITMDGSTRGGLVGDRIELIDIAADVWAVQMWAAGTGTEATPFTAAVS